MKYYCLPVLLCAFVHLAKAADTYEPNAKRRYEIALECIADTSVDRRLIEEVIRTSILPPRTNLKYKQFLACSYKKQKYLSEDGKTMLFKNIVEFLSNFYNREHLTALKVCEDVAGVDEGDLAYNALECTLNVLRPLTPKT